MSPVVWKLGATSFLTDVSAEMVNSALPLYLVLFLRMSPLEYGAIDALYNGFAIALLSLGAGVVADRTRRPKHVAVGGYGLSAACKLLLLAAGGTWTWILATVWLDRTGKGIRTAPRDAMISLNSPAASLATAFAVHRALDAGGSLLGPLVTFAVLWYVPTGYGAVWITSFAFAVLGLAVLVLLVPNTRAAPDPIDAAVSLPPARARIFTPRFGALAACGLLLSTVTISDGFLYLLLQDKRSGDASLLPLFYVVTAAFYMLFSIPVGIGADRVGRIPVLVAGYGLLGLVYVLLMQMSALGVWRVGALLGLLGLFYAATEGILAAMASAVIPAERRTSGLAILGTVMGLGKAISSLVFGWMWQTYGAGPSLAVFAGTLAVALGIAGVWLRATRHG